MKIKLKLLLLSMMFIGLGLSFCSADGIYHNSSLGLISVVYNGQTVYTLQDKNLGATCTDVSQSCSYGNYYQRGNNYGFSSDSNLSYTLDSSTSIDFSNYGPGNYFNSNGIFYSHTVYVSSNHNLWGGITDTYEARQGPCSDGYYILSSWSPFISVIHSIGVSTSNGISISNYLYLPFAGLRQDVAGAPVGQQGVWGVYWSSTAYSDSRAYDLYYISSSLSSTDNSNLSQGYSVRCFKKDVVNPDYTWDKLYGDTLEVPPHIKVNYNNGESSVNILCDGSSEITIDGSSTITSTNTRTPYFNIDYVDEDNQFLVESYSKDILYLRNGLFKKTYTGDNERILTNQSECSIDSSFSGYTPTFDIVFTGDTRQDTGNVFNNFTQNSLQVLLSNIPSYIQYVIIIMLLFFILGLARRKKRR